MKLLKKITAAALAAAMLVLSGCSGGEAAQTDVTTTAFASVTTVGETTTEAATTAPDETTADSSAAPADETTAQESAETTEAATEQAADTTAASPQISAPATTTAPATSAAPAATTAAQSASGNNKTVTISALSLPSDVEKIVTAMGAGWDLGNSLDAYNGNTPSETAWGNPKVTRELIHAVKAAGFSTIRIPVSYMGKADSSGNIDKDWLDRVQTIVDYAMDEGLYVVINVHHDGNNDTNSWIDVTAADQAPIRTKFAGMWKQIAERFKSYGERLIFEAMNEILEEGNYSTNLKADTYPNINALNQLFVDTVRATGGTNASRWLLIPGYNTNIDAITSDIGFVLPKDSAKNKLMVSVHFYDPYDLCLNENKKIYKWGVDATKGGKTTWGHEDYVEQQFKKMYDKFTSQGVPVILGEYGIIDKNYVNEMSYQYRRYYLEYVAKSAVNHGIVPIYWDNGYDGKNGFAIFSRKTATILYPELADAIVRGASRKDYAIEIPYTNA